MAIRGLASVTLRRSQHLKHFFSTSRNFIISSQELILHKPGIAVGPPRERDGFTIGGLITLFHSNRCLNTVDKCVEPITQTESNAVSDDKKKRKKLKGKRAVVKWLKFFRWKKKKEYERMTAEEKILYKLRKAQKKEERLVESLKKIEPKESSETRHDPEVLTPEEHFYFLKMGQKCKNYVPVGRRGIYQGVILNMHLHWKKHQTLQVIVKTFSPEEVKEIAVELARLTGGIVLDIQDENTIIMYRGKNYSQPPTEIMSPRITLGRKKALDKSKYLDGLRAVRKFIPRLEQDLDLLKAQAANKPGTTEQTPPITSEISDMNSEGSDKLREIMARADEPNEEAEDSNIDSEIEEDSEALSDIFETESDRESEEREERYLFLDKFEKFPAKNDGESEDFEEELRRMSEDSRRKKKSMEKDVESSDFDEVDRMILQAASLLRKKRR